MTTCAGAHIGIRRISPVHGVKAWSICMHSFRGRSRLLCGSSPYCALFTYRFAQKFHAFSLKFPCTCRCGLRSAVELRDGTFMEAHERKKAQDASNEAFVGSVSVGTVSAGCVHHRSIYGSPPHSQQPRYPPSPAFLQPWNQLPYHPAEV